MIETIGEAMVKETIVEPNPAQRGDVRRAFADIFLSWKELLSGLKTGVAEGIRQYVVWFDRGR